MSAVPIAAPPARRGLKWQGDPTAGGMLAVVLAVSALIVVLPAMLLWLSFRDAHPVEPVSTYSLGNFVKAFGDAFLWQVLANTLGFSVITLVVALAFGLSAAWLVVRTDLPAKSLLYTLMTLGVLMPGFATAMGWLFLLHPRIGLLNQWFMDTFKLTDAPLNIATVPGMGFVQGLSLAPVAFVMTAAVLRAIDPSLEESAHMSGVRFSRILRRVTLPLAWPGILAAGIYIFTIGFAAFDVPAIIGWSNKVYTFSTYLVVQLTPSQDLPQYGPVAAVSTLVIALAGVLGVWYTRLQKDAHRYQVVTGKGYRPRILELRGYKVLAWLFLGTYLALAMLLPLLVVIWASLLPYFQLPSMDALRSTSLEQFQNVPWDVLSEAIRNSGLLMLLTPTATLVVAVCFSWVVLRSKAPGRGVFDFIAFLPHAIPNILFGVSVLLFSLYFTRGALNGTLWILLFVFIIARLSYATRMTNSALIQLHRDLEEAASMSGASTWVTVRRVLVPLLTPTLIYAWLWMALLTFRELTLALILTTRDNVTVPVLIWSMWTSHGLGTSAAITLILMAMMVPLIALYWWFVRKRGLMEMT